MARTRKTYIKAKPDELKVAWGYDSESFGPDVVVANGDNVSVADAYFLSGILSLKRARIASTNQLAFDPSVLAELESRGYDLSTLKISIQKKAK